MENQEVKICRDCGNQFELTAGELEFYTAKIQQDPTFAMPKRCQVCRRKKKLERAKERGNAYPPRDSFGMSSKELGIE